MEKLSNHTPRIRFSHVGKVFETRFQTITAVHDYSMDIQPGEFVAILGPSGCGKSTLIRMLDGIIPPSSGEILLDEELVSGRQRMGKDILRKMGFIFQQPNLLPWYTLRENVALPLKIFGLSGKKWEKRVDKLLAMVGLTGQDNAYPVEISGGMAQRAGVIRAMVHDPEILLMDEPFGALDELSREQLNMELLDIWKQTGKTIIFITHNVQEAVLVSSRIYVMATQPGRLQEVVDIGLPRPRELSMITSPAFMAYEKQITDLIGHIELSSIK